MQPSELEQECHDVWQQIIYLENRWAGTTMPEHIMNQYHALQARHKKLKDQIQ